VFGCRQATASSRRRPVTIWRRPMRRPDRAWARRQNLLPIGRTGGLVGRHCPDSFGYSRQGCVGFYGKAPPTPIARFLGLNG
jgi:hypothetical protein